jgi:hypothetical protein
MGQAKAPASSIESPPRRAGFLGRAWRFSTGHRTSPESALRLLVSPLCARNHGARRSGRYRPSRPSRVRVPASVALRSRRRRPADHGRQRRWRPLSVRRPMRHPPGLLARRGRPRGNGRYLHLSRQPVRRGDGGRRPQARRAAARGVWSARRWRRPAGGCLTAIRRPSGTGPRALYLSPRGTLRFAGGARTKVVASDARRLPSKRRSESVGLERPLRGQMLRSGFIETSGRPCGDSRRSEAKPRTPTTRSSALLNSVRGALAISRDGDTRAHRRATRAFPQVGQRLRGLDSGVCRRVADARDVVL